MTKLELLKRIVNLSHEDTLDFFTLQQECQRELSAEIFASTTGKTSDRSLVSTIIKLLAKMENKGSLCAGVYRNSAEKQVITYDGHMMIIFEQELPLELYDGKAKRKFERSSIDKLEQSIGIDCDKTVKITKKHLAYYRATKVKFINISGVIFSVDTLKKVIDITGDIILMVDTKRPISPCGFTANGTKGLICPYHKADREEAIEYKEIL